MFSDIDLDDLFAYRTKRTLHIRDRKLCFAQLLVLLGVFFYVVIWEVIVKEGYLVRELPQGIVRLSFLDNGSDGGAYCGQQTPTAKGLNYKQLPCLDWDYVDAVHPSAENDAIFLSTRVKEIITLTNGSNPQCRLNITSCSNSVSTETYFVGRTGTYTLLVQHAIYGQDKHTLLRERDMKYGKLTKPDGSMLLSFSDRGSSRIGDIITMSELLTAAGFNLDDQSPSTTTETTRYSGTTILLFIYYGAPKFSTSSVKYKIQAVQFPIEYKYEQVIYDQTKDSANNNLYRRTVLDRHGLRIVVVQGGFLGHFSFIELVKTLVTAFAFLGFSSFVVEKILIRFLPLARVYQAYKYHYSVDCGDTTRLPDGNFLVKNGEEEFILSAEDIIFGTLYRGGRTKKHRLPSDPSASVRAQKPGEQILPQLNPQPDTFVYPHGNFGSQYVPEPLEHAVLPTPYQTPEPQPDPALVPPVRFGVPV